MTVAVQDSDALGVKVRVPDVQLSVVIVYQTCPRTSSLYEAVGPTMLLSVSPFGPDGAVTDVTSVESSQAIFQISRSPADALGWLTAHSASAVLLPLTVQSPDSMIGLAGEGEIEGEIEGEREGEIEGERDGLNEGDSEADGD